MEWQASREAWSMVIPISWSFEITSCVFGGRSEAKAVLEC